MEPTVMEAKLLGAVAASPGDADARLVYADWLEENGALGKAAFLRAQLAMARLPAEDPKFPELARELQRLLPETEATWRAAIAQKPVENCTFVVRCPARWEQLRPTSQPAVRHCEACRRDVHYCSTDEDLRGHAEAGRCVAVDLVVLRRPGDLRPSEGPMMLGMPAVGAFPELVEAAPPPPAPTGAWSRLLKLLGR